MTRKEYRNYLRERESDIKAHNKEVAIIKECYQNSKPIPFHLREKAKDLMDDIIFDTQSDSIKKRFTREQNIYITTSREPSSQLRQFVKHLSLIFNATLISRGGMTIQELSEQKFDVLMIVGESKGKASSLIITYMPYGPTFHFSLHNVKMDRREKSIKKNVNLILENFTTETGLMVKDYLSVLFPIFHDSSKSGKVVPAKRSLVFINKDDLIRFRHFFNEDRIQEDVISFDMKLYRINRGSIEFEGEPIFSLNNFINTAGKNNIL
ncbi:U3 small nucleolar ribonucleoprotein (snoRNP) component [Pseudoloma neurophilia]|uniref:U3 small nucleolar ribonucleoprotein protein IMP4 n=1 Tax=Pseudoloma neurophilia TaxID=146866 RepID=A0A0R0M8P3_9MICR|nr:U3 small nucleolar ribonucleoprotein (snoRNP) component [Pseudoloma neurophilia]